jgi:hypothetical protein
MPISRYPDWETLAKDTIVSHGGRKYHILEIPKGTHIYRGFCRSRLENGLYYGSLGVAFYYANHPDYCRSIGWTHIIQEYVTKEDMKLYDLGVWENLKYIVDDLGGENVFEYPYGFNPQEKTELIRFAGDDEEMVDKIKEWLELDSSPKLNGFGCREIKMILEGDILEQLFHAEIACTTPSSLELVNTYYATKPNSKVYINKKNSKDTLEWVDMRGGKKQRKRKTGMKMKIGMKMKMKMKKTNKKRQNANAKTTKKNKR